MEDGIDYAVSTVKTWIQNLQFQLKATFTEMSAQRYIRMVIIVCVYILIRPFLLKIGEKIQAKQLDKIHAADREAESSAAAKISPNTLRGQRVVELPEEDSDEGEEGEGQVSSGADWGKKARKRQRQAERRALEAEEKRRKEEEEDEDDRKIEEFMMENHNWVGKQERNE